MHRINVGYCIYKLSLNVLALTKMHFKLFENGWMFKYEYKLSWTCHLTRTE